MHLIHDLYAHSAWADAVQWRALLDFEPAREDADLKARFFHMHAAQQVWLGRWQGISLPWPSLEQYPNLTDLRHFGAACHAASQAFLATLTPADLDREQTFTLLSGAVVTQPLRDTILQLPMHSQYHRGQNATRMVALGAHMPSTDYVTWTRQGRPAAEWP